MRALGLNVGKGFIRFAVIEGTLAQPVLLDRNRLTRGKADEFDHDFTMSLPERMAWLEGGFATLLDRVAPDMVAYRMHNGRGMTQEQVAVFHYPWGILNLLCGRRGLPCQELLSASLTAKRFGLPKGQKPMERVDEILADGAKWDNDTRYAACAAWAVLA